MLLNNVIFHNYSLLFWRKKKSKDYFTFIPFSDEKKNQKIIPTGCFFLGQNMVINGPPI